uniref:Uncharacterized protein n=1 Tax=Knipowitschia caucasica TaxID=637954 RepID=A0AAV2K3K7_KNICA
MKRTAEAYLLHLKCSGFVYYCQNTNEDWDGNTPPEGAFRFSYLLRSSPRSSSCSNPAGFQLGGSTSRPRFHVPAPVSRPGPGFTSRPRLHSTSRPRLHVPTPAPRPDPGSTSARLHVPDPGSTSQPWLHVPTPAPRPSPGSTPRPRLHVPAPAFPTVPLPPWLFFGRLGSVP